MSGQTEPVLSDSRSAGLCFPAAVRGVQGNLKDELLMKQEVVDDKYLIIFWFHFI